MKRNAVILLVMAAAVALILFSGRIMENRADGERVRGGNVAGQPAPEFELKDMDGKTVRLSDFRGKAVLVNFWATWCNPCKVEMPWLVDLRNQYAEQGFEVLGIAQDDSGREAIVRFAQEMGVNYPILQGTNAVGDAYSVFGMPTSYYLDRQGRIVERHVGLPVRSHIEKAIQKALAGAPPADEHAGHDHPPGVEH